MKTIRITPSQLNPVMVNFAEYYGYAIKTCRPYRARTKGKVERAIHYVRTSFIPEKIFDSLEDANAQAQYWLENEANRRIHSTTKSRPCDLLENEGLQNHSAMMPYLYSEKVSRNANHEGYVRFGGNRYSVPLKGAGKAVEVEHIGTTIRIYLKDAIIAEHKQAEGKAKVVSHPEHIAEMWKLIDKEVNKPECKDLIQFNKEVEKRDLIAYEEFCK